MVEFPTRCTEDTSNILDLFFTNNDTLVNRIEPLPGISDHDIVFVESSLRPQITKPEKRKIYQFHKANFDSFRSDINDSDISNEEFRNRLSVDNLWEAIKNLITKLTDKHVPSKIITGNPKRKPWITARIRNCRKKEQKFYRLARNSRTARHIQRYKKIKANNQKLIRNSYYKYINSIIDQSSLNDRASSQKKFWHYIKSLKKDSSGIAP